MKLCSYFLIYLNKFLNEDLKNKKVQIIELSKNDSNKYKWFIGPEITVKKIFLLKWL